VCRAYLLAHHCFQRVRYASSTLRV
jgi:hypothetical protein